MFCALGWPEFAIGLMPPRDAPWFYGLSRFSPVVSIAGCRLFAFLSSCCCLVSYLAIIARYKCCGAFALMVFAASKRNFLCFLLASTISRDLHLSVDCFPSRNCTDISTSLRSMLSHNCLMSLSSFLLFDCLSTSLFSGMFTILVSLLFLSSRSHPRTC